MNQLPTLYCCLTHCRGHIAGNTVHYVGFKTSLSDSNVSLKNRIIWNLTELSAICYLVDAFRCIINKGL